MEDKISRLAELITKYLQKDLDPDEDAALQHIVNESETGRKRFYEFIAFAESAGLQEALKAIGNFKAEADDLWPLVAEKYKSKQETKVIDISPKRHQILRYVAAAVLVIIASGLYLWNHFKNEKPVANAEVEKTVSPNDIPPPDGSQTVLTLSNGQQVILDETGNGNIATEGHVNVTKQDDQLLYGANQATQGATVLYNTLITKRGGFFKLQLPDNSMVWLNASSSITYPVSFGADERKVTITGEAYFEVNSQPLMGGKKVPFIVEANGVQTEVLGTHFNVSAYNDNEKTSVTLLEGSVRVSGNGKSVVIKPGEQAQVTGNQEPVTSNRIDLDQVMAWKNGNFYFSENTSLGDIMQEIERWYDVEVVYEGKIPDRIFGGIISRHTNLSEVLKMLEFYGVHFRMEGRNIIVLK